MNGTRGRFMKIGVELINILDYSKKYETQLALTLLYKGLATYMAWDDTIIETTPTTLIKTFTKYGNINQRQMTNVIEALVDMRDRGLIEFDGIPKAKDMLSIDLKNLIHLSMDGEMFVELLINDFYSIMEVNSEENGIESMLLQAFIEVKARWNFKTIEYLSQFDTGEIARDITTDQELQQAKGVFCSDSLDFIRTHKHYMLEEIPTWCDKDKLNDYLNILQEIGCIKIYRRKVVTSNGVRTCSFYYIPTMSDEAIEMMVRQYVKRMKYKFKEEHGLLKENEPKHKKQGEPFPRIRRRRFR